MDEGENGVVAIDLILRETRPPVLHGVRGLHQKGPSRATPLITTAWLDWRPAARSTSGGRTYPVTGRSWMDHEFGTSALTAGAVGWDWFSIQFDNGAILIAL
jgi:predicted secreted hydrolase